MAEHEVTIDRLAVGVDDLDVVQQPVERLRLADLGDQLGHRVVPLVRLADVLRLLADLHRDPGVLGFEVVVVDLDLLGGGDRAQREVDLDRLLRLLAQPSTNEFESCPVADSHSSRSMPCA